MIRLFSRPVSLIVISGVVVAGPIWWHFYRPMPTLAVASEQGVGASPSAGKTLEVALIRAGIDAKALAASGVHGPSVAGVAVAASQYIAQHPTALSSADAAYATARRESDRLLRLIQSGKATQEEVAAYASQKAALDTATEQREAVLTAIFNAATANLTEPNRVVLAKIRANKHWSLPTEYLTVDRTEQEWVNVRSALANERISLASNETPDAEWQLRLAEWRADPTVAAAKVGLDTHLSGVTTALNQATSND